ncbi:MAG TPA: 2-C-methyl-D-erythritol 2,4-cyclodiphosphate synthase [Coxiellaceae bacterium]|nr:2-C-methyl-D-erythritol 2,4-cyclodiphosphate synthase [Coxiellaceae bacterium]
MNHTTFTTLVGTGFDVHALKKAPQQHIMLCGICVPCDFQVIAHSDGDVALHALTDALLGAIGAGDIGEHFPPTDMRWKGADSTQFLTHALQLCSSKNATLNNIDLTIICEAPKITPYKQAMKEKLILLTGLSSERINIKATTTEKLGFLGRQEGIAAQAIVSVAV